MWHNIKEFFMNWIWQLPQNLLGLGYAFIVYNDLLGYIASEDRRYTIYLKESNGGITLGKHIFVYKRYNNLPLIIQHELGHVKQSRLLGPLYLLVVGIPSILWASIHTKIAPNKDYYWFYTESWANKLVGIR